MMRFLGRAQFGLSDLLLLIAATAAITATVASHQRITRLKAQIVSLQHAAGEIVLWTPTEYHAIARTVVRYPDEAWQVYLPEGNHYELHAATRAITDEGAPSQEAAPPAEISAGIHEIQLRHEQGPGGEPKLVILCDDVPVLEAIERPDWNPSGESTATGVGKTQESKPVSEWLVLKRLRVNAKMPTGSQSSPPKEPVNGLLVWITRKQEGRE